MARMWAMSYQKSRLRTGGGFICRTGYHITDKHPVAVIHGWNEHERQREANAPEQFKCYPWVHALTWYVELSEQEQADMTSAGVDLTAVDHEIDVAAQ